MKHFRCAAILFLVLALLLNGIPALGEGTQVFPFLDGLDWDSTPADLERTFGKAGKEETDESNNGLILSFENILMTGGGFSANLAFSMSREKALSAVIYDVEVSVIPEFFYGRITEQMSKIYAGGEIIFDSLEGMAAAQDDESDNALVKSSLIAGTRTILENVYGDYSTQISSIKGWMPDRNTIAVAAFGKRNGTEDQILICLVNFDRLFSQMSADTKEGAPDVFSMPAGIAWNMTPQEVVSALQAAGYTPETDQDGNIQVEVAGPDGNSMTWMGSFSTGGTLAVSTFLVFGMDYPSAFSLITDAIGQPFEENSENLKQTFEANFGASPDHASAWIGATELTYLFDFFGIPFFMQIPLSALNAF